MKVEAKICEIKHEIETNNKLLGLLKFRRVMTEYNLGDNNVSNFNVEWKNHCHPCKLWKILVGNNEIENDELKLCPKHSIIFYSTKKKAEKDNSRLEKRLWKLETSLQTSL